MRAFIGIDLEPEWREALGRGCETVRDVVPGWRDHKWVAPENLHITLKFLGDISADAAQTLPEDLEEALRDVDRFELPVRSFFEASPSHRTAKILWTTFDDDRGHCSGLADRIETVAERYGVLPDTRDFFPHVTLCRARRPRSFTVAEQATAAAVDSLTAHRLEAVVSVLTVTVYKSTLTREGAHYDRLSVLRLAD